MTEPPVADITRDSVLRFGYVLCDGMATDDYDGWLAENGLTDVVGIRETAERARKYLCPDAQPEDAPVEAAAPESDQRCVAPDGTPYGLMNPRQIEDTKKYAKPDDPSEEVWNEYFCEYMPLQTDERRWSSLRRAEAKHEARVMCLFIYLKPEMKSEYGPDGPKYFALAKEHICPTDEHLDDWFPDKDQRKSIWGVG